MRVLICAGACILLSGCVSLVSDVVTAPVKIVSKTADVLTTSQSEADEKRGREMRKREETLGNLSRRRDKAAERCEDGSEAACRKVIELDDQIEAEQNRVI
jgi:hypothetical protein